jgi:hypothetical protein
MTVIRPKEYKSYRYISNPLLTVNCFPGMMCFELSIRKANCFKFEAKGMYYLLLLLSTDYEFTV